MSPLWSEQQKQGSPTNPYETAFTNGWASISVWQMSAEIRSEVAVEKSRGHPFDWRGKTIRLWRMRKSVSSVQNAHKWILYGQFIQLEKCSFLPQVRLEIRPDQTQANAFEEEKFCMRHLCQTIHIKYKSAESSGSTQQSANAKGSMWYLSFVVSLPRFFLQRSISF